MELFNDSEKNKGHRAKNGGHKKKTSSGGRTAAVLAIVLTLLVLVCAGGVLLVRNIDTVYPNVSLDGMDIGGMTDLELARFLLEKGYESAGDESVKVEFPLDYELEIKAADVCTDVAVADIVDNVMSSCRGSGAVDGAVNYLKCLAGGMELESGGGISVDETAVRARVDSLVREVNLKLLSSEFTVDESSLRLVKGAKSVSIDAQEITNIVCAAFREQNYEPIVYDAGVEADEKLDLVKLREEICCEAEDAYYDPETGSIQPEKIGVDFDAAQAQSLWDGAKYGEEVVIPLELTQPAVTEESLGELLFRDKLSEKTTSLWGSSSNRVNNVTKAAAAIDETVLMPGEEFSYNTALGERTAENGYLPAGAYSGGQTVQEYGGGICQVSSTLYYCALYANLRITARSCHMFPVNYLPPGLDATVSWGGPEFKFVNSREYPIRIVSFVDGNNVTVEIWGTDVDGSYVEMTYGTSLMYDSKYTDVEIGYRATTYRSVYDKDGNLLSQTKEAGSTYNYHQEDIKWPEESPEPSAEPSQEPGVTEEPAETPVPDVSDEPVYTGPPIDEPQQDGEETPEPTEPV